MLAIPASAFYSKEHKHLGANYVRAATTRIGRFGIFQGLWNPDCVASGADKISCHLGQTLDQERAGHSWRCSILVVHVSWRAHLASTSVRLICVSGALRILQERRDLASRW